MALYNFHRVLISTAILFFFGFALYAFRVYHAGATRSYLAMALVSALVSVVTVGYLIYFNYRLRVLRHAGILDRPPA